jgi:hypothetical protein
MSEEHADYVNDALEMIGQQPAAIIDPPRTVKSLSDNGIADYQVWGWVKTSAKFIAHIKVLRGAKLAIWMCLALSIDETGKCKATIKKICELTGYSHTEVIDSLKELDGMGYLTVERDAKGNIYNPQFVARGESLPSEKTVKKLDSTPAYQVESSPALENSAPSFNRVKRVNTPKGDLVDLELSKLPAMSIRKAVHEYFRLNVNWETKHSRQWMEWAVEQEVTAEQIQRAAETWRSDKLFNWQPPTLKGVFEKWQMLMDAGKVAQPTEHRIKNLEREL